MAKPRTPNQKKAYSSLKSRLVQYSSLVDAIFDQLNKKAAQTLFVTTDYSASSSKPFSWSDYPLAKERVRQIQTSYVDSMTGLIYAGTSNEWRESNTLQDLLANSAFKAYHIDPDTKKYEHYYQDNSDALKAFNERCEKGMNLSQRLWNQSEEYKNELECAISLGIQRGTNAVSLSTQLRQYLNDFPRLQREYKLKYSREPEVRNARYAAKRLAVTEINMAYRTAENKRWEQMDFVVGIEIKTSDEHFNRMPKGDVCDTLQGRYPKDFQWRGWHPNCLCYQIPILKTEDEFWADMDKEEPTTESENEVTEIPDNFEQWIEDNRERIETASERGTLPYFIQDNQQIVTDILTPSEAPEEHRLTALEIAAERHANRTPEQEQAIRDAWADREALLLAPTPLINLTTPDWTYDDSKKLSREEKCLQQLEGLQRYFGPNWQYNQVADSYKPALRVGFSSAAQNCNKNFLRYFKGAEPCLIAVNHLDELKTTDLSVIPEKWRATYNALIDEINKYDITANGYRDIYDKIEKAYNIFKLSSNADVQALGIDNISINTPYNLFTEYFKKYPDMKNRIPPKEFWDALPNFVPLDSNGTSGACYHSEYRYVHIPLKEPRLQQGEVYQRIILPHEFGHAFDFQRDLSSSDQDLIDLWTDYKNEIAQDNGRTIADAITMEWRDVESRLFAQYGDKFRKSDAYNNFIEQACALSDVLQAASPSHIAVCGGHEISYYSSPHQKNQLLEFFAHCSENYWTGNNVFKKIAPKLYDKTIELVKNKWK